MRAWSLLIATALAVEIVGSFGCSRARVAAPDVHATTAASAASSVVAPRAPTPPRAAASAAPVAPVAVAPVAVAPVAVAPGAVLPSPTAPVATPGAACPPPPRCDVPPPAPAARVRWNHPIATRVTAALGAPRHRARDLLVRVGEPQVAVAKFAYGLGDDDLSDEDVDVYALRDCARWELLGTARTTDDDAAPHAPVDAVDDRGGRVFFPIPADRTLGLGWHRLHFVARGDGSSADAFVDVIAPEARVVVSDVDGTLTEQELAEFRTVLGGASPAANPGAPEAMWALARRGYQLFYLTARPEWLTARTRDWLSERGFPRGIVHTTTGLTGAFGAPARDFKVAELRALLGRLGRPPALAFGNQPSDVEAFASGSVAPERAFFYRLTENLRGGRAVTDYRALVAEFDALPTSCP